MELQIVFKYNNIRINNINELSYFFCYSMINVMMFRWSDEQFESH